MFGWVGMSLFVLESGHVHFLRTNDVLRALLRAALFAFRAPGSANFRGYTHGPTSFFAQSLRCAGIDLISR